MSIPDNRQACPYKCEYPGCDFGAHKPKVNWNGDDTAILCPSHIKSEVIGPLVDERDALQARLDAVVACIKLWSREDAGLTLNLAANDLRAVLDGDTP